MNRNSINMKAGIVTLFFICVTLFVQGQKCNRTGSFIGAGDVDVTGTATVEVQSDGSLVIKFASDFVSDQGPDLDVYLGNTAQVNSSSVRVKALSSFTGAQTYAVPSNIKLGDYNYVSVWCTQYSHYYGAALLGTETGTCSVTSTLETGTTKDVKLTFYSNEITINATNNLKNVSLLVYSSDGKLLHSENIPSIVGSYTLEKIFSNFRIVVLKSDDLVLTEKVLFK